MQLNAPTWFKAHNCDNDYQFQLWSTKSVMHDKESGIKAFFP